MSCPCGNKDKYEDCCGRFISGDAKPETAEQLMRSRYTAYTKEEVDYVVSTHDAASRDDVDRDGALKWAQEADWDRLDVLHTEAGGPDDDEGVVEFVARYAIGGKPMDHHERAVFKKHDGQWFYHDGEMVKRKPVKREGRKVGRNEPCPCGSGNKYKKCCGRA